MKRYLLVGPQGAKDSTARRRRKKQAAVLHTTCNSDTRFR